MTNPSSRRKRLLAGAAVAGMLSTLGPLGVLPAGAQTAINTSTACANVPANFGGFTDIAGSVHEANIRCAAAAGLIQGTTATTFNPSGQLTRQQAALIFARFVTAGATTLDAPGGPDLPDLPAYGGTNRFTDVTDAEAIQAVNRLAAANIILGKTATTFDPSGTLTRAQLASIINRVQQFLAGAPLPAGPNRFTDDNGSVHEDAINRVANAGIVQGLTATTFGPTQNATRAQVATIVVRHIAVNVAGGAFVAVPAPMTMALVTVTPNATATATVGTARQYMATLRNADGTPYIGRTIIRLLDATAAGAPNGTTLATNVVIETVDGTTTATGIGTAEVTGVFAGLDGQVTFVIRSSAAATSNLDAIPQVTADLDNDGVVDTGEPTGLGGAAVFTYTPPEATTTATGATVASTNKAANFFVVGGVRYEYDENDIFTGSGVSSLATFEAALTPGSTITIDPYSVAETGQSTFSLTNIAVTALTATSASAGMTVDAATATISGVGNPGYTVSVYLDVANNNVVDFTNDPLVASTTVSEDGAYSVSVPLTQNAPNNFLVVQRVTGTTGSFTGTAVDIATITESATAGVTITAAAVTNDAAPTGVLSPGDVITLNLSATTTAATTASLTLRDIDGTVLTLTGGSGVTVAGTGTTTVTFTVNSIPTSTTAGSTAGLQYPAQIDAVGGLTAATGGTAISLGGGSDVIVS